MMRMKRHQTLAAVALLALPAHAQTSAPDPSVDELLPKVRQLNPRRSDEDFLETAESMAELRLLDEEIG